MSSSPSIAWLALLSTDPTASASFYSATLGWRAVPVNDSTTEFIDRNGALVGHVRRVPQEPWGSDGWVPFFAVGLPQDALAGARRQRALVVDYGPEAWLAVDIHGARFGVVPRSGEPAPFAAHVELATTDVDEAAAFYGAIFDVRIERLAGDLYGFRAMFAADGTGAQIGGLMNVSEFHKSGPAPQWMPYFRAGDVDEVTRRALDLGALLRIPPSWSPFDRYSVLADPSGVLFGLSDMRTPIRLPEVDALNRQSAGADPSIPTA